MDDFLGFLFGAALVIAVVVAVAIFVLVAGTTALLNLYMILEQVMSGWWFLPRPWSWGLTSAVFVGLMHFACAESRELRRPALRGGLILLAITWLVASGVASQVNASSARPRSEFSRWFTGLFTSVSGPTKPPVSSYPPPPQPLGDSDKARQSAYVNTTQLNVRNGPGVPNPVVGKLNKGMAVRVFERRAVAGGATWVHIQSGGIDGWVNERLLSYGR